MTTGSSEQSRHAKYLQNQRQKPYSIVDYEYIQRFFDGKKVCIVGSGPGSLKNEEGFIDSHTVVRINNFKLGGNLGERTDVFYSFFGKSVRISHDMLKKTKLMMCKCPNDKIESKWHEQISVIDM